MPAAAVGRDVCQPAFARSLRAMEIQVFRYFSARLSSKPWVTATTRSIAQSSASPIPIAIYNPCHGNVPQLVEAAKRGVMLSGALPMVFPTISIHESFASPTSMFLRNLMAMETEEMIRGAADGFRDPDRWLRQDLAGADHGCGEHGCTRPVSSNRPDERGQPSWGEAGSVYRLPAFLGQVPRRAD